MSVWLCLQIAFCTPPFVIYLELRDSVSTVYYESYLAIPKMQNFASNGLTYVRDK